MVRETGGKCPARFIFNHFYPHLLIWRKMFPRWIFGEKHLWICNFQYSLSSVSHPSKIPPSSFPQPAISQMAPTSGSALAMPMGRTTSETWSGSGNANLQIFISEQNTVWGVRLINSFCWHEIKSPVLSCPLYNAAFNLMSTKASNQPDGSPCTCPIFIQTCPPGRWMRAMSLFTSSLLQASWTIMLPFPALWKSCESD